MPGGRNSGAVYNMYKVICSFLNTCIAGKEEELALNTHPK